MARAGLVLALLALLAHGAAAAAILGIDFGTNLIKVAYVQPAKAFDIVLNANSKRKSANILGLDRGSRLYDTDALGLAARDPAHVFMRSRDLLGVPQDGEEVQHLRDSLVINYELVPDEETGGFRIAMDKGTDEEKLFRPEEIVGMILAHVKRMSASYIESEVSDCVITVPPYFSQAQREALLTSAEIAGLNVLTLIDENVAAAVQHGVYSEFPETPNYVLIYNMGSASTKVTLFNFWGKPAAGKNAKAVTQIEVLAKAWDLTLGGDALDMNMVNMIVSEFDGKHFADGSDSVRSSSRAFERIRAQAQKVKTVLSANAEIPVSIESLHNGQDLRMHVTRAEFETYSKDFFERVTGPVDKVLKDAGITVADLSAIELIGGGIRVPRIKQVLSDYFTGQELGSHLNGDEAKAFGAVFVAANMSKTFRVRPVGLTDITLDPVIVELAEAGETADSEWHKDAVLFNASSPLNARKVVSFKRENDIVCTLKRGGANSPVAFAEYEVTGVADAIAKFGQFGKPKVSLTYILTHSDTVVLQKAEAVFTEEIAPETETEEAPAEEGANETGDADGQSTESTEAASAEAEGAEAEAKESEDVEAEPNATADDEAKKPKEKKAKTPTKKTHRFTLAIKRTDRGVAVKQLSPEQVQESRNVLAAYDNEEEEQRLHEAAKNELESFIFSSRDKVRSNEEQVDIVFSEEDKEKLFEDLEALEDWLDEDEGENAPIKEYNLRRSALDKRIKKLFRRVDELDQRPATVRAARKFVATLRKQVNTVWATERPWITEAEKEHVLAAIGAFESWLDAIVSEQDSTSLQQEPVFTASDVVSHLEPLHDLLEHALKRSKPRPPKVKKKVEKAADVETGSDGEEAKAADGEKDAGTDAEADTESSGTEPADEPEPVAENETAEESETEKDEL